MIDPLLVSDFDFGDYVKSAAVGERSEFTGRVVYRRWGRPDVHYGRVVYRRWGRPDVHYLVIDDDGVVWDRSFKELTLVPTS